ncbi:hypothetical protein [Clostridium butyricum]|uniref:hypothetical protein n=1 Tax=Clostridium butyricum TaxID=1492 RepID=UPI001F57583A|nr:hypothetical protein [Clostridium butyricum]
MKYKFKALVIDDEVQIKVLCETYKKKLRIDYDIDIEFEVINDECNYDDSKLYDILLVDYDLKKGYSKNLMGDDIIRKFREKNSVSKIVFYSSSFIYDLEERTYQLPLSHKDIFELINDYGVDYIAYKNNFEMMIDVIKKCCDKSDILSQLLLKLLEEYSKEEIEITYNNVHGNEIEITSLRDDLLRDTYEGKNFRKQVIETILSTLLNYKY